MRLLRFVLVFWAILLAVFVAWLRRDAKDELRYEGDEYESWRFV